MPAERGRNAIFFATAFLAAAALSAAAVRASDFAPEVRVEPFLTSAGAPAPASGQVWISVDPADLPKLKDSPLAGRVAALSGERASVFRVPVESLPELSELMHERFGRCGGFFAYDSKEEAAEALSASPPAAASAYTIDQASVVKPVVSRVKEGELRSTLETLGAYQNRYYQADAGVAAAKWVQARWQALAASFPGASTRLVAHPAWKQPSVVLTIPGSEMPEEVVVLGGHLDSINGWGGEKARAPGVDDNASGIAVLTETVRVLAVAGFRPKRTIEVMGYAAEEVGLRGSKDIAKQYARQGAKVTAVIQFDMTNFKGSPGEIYLLDDNVDPGLTAFLGQLIDAYLGVSWSKTKCGYACSDHASWSSAGYAASAAFESAFDGMNKNIHSEKDTLANSGGTAEHSVAFARLAAAFAIETAKSAGTSLAAK